MTIKFKIKFFPTANFQRKEKIVNIIRIKLRKFMLITIKNNI